MPESTVEQLNKKTRDYSIKEGSAASVMGGAGESYITPFAAEIGASNLQIGLMSSLVNLAGPVFQLLGSRLPERFSRKKIVFISIVLQASAWLLFILIGWLDLHGGKLAYLPLLLIAAYIFYVCCGAIGGPSWFSLLGDAVPEVKRAKYFSKRNKITGLFSVAAALAASLWLFFAKDAGLLIIGFIALFSIALIARLVSAYFFSKHYVAPITLDRGYWFSFWNFVSKIPTGNFNRFAAYVAVMNLVMNIANPFFALYMWKDLALNPIWFAIVATSAGIFSALSMTLWGRFAEKYGNRELLRVGSLLLALMPFLWLLSRNPIYLVLIAQLISGIGSAAFNLSASNFIYDSVSRPRRAICVAYFNLLNGIGIFFGSLIGGLLAQYLHLKFMSIFLFIFIVSGVLRLLITEFFLPLVKEIKAVSRPARKNPLLYIWDFAPYLGVFTGRIAALPPNNLTARIKSLAELLLTKVKK